MPKLGHENYIRPPLVATEPGSGRAGVWRFRIVFGLVLAAILVGIFFLYQAITAGPGEGSPGIGGSARPAASAFAGVERRSHA